MQRRWIAHLDMDAFYASVELLRYPELKGRAVVVGGRRVPAPVRGADGSHEFGRLRGYAGRGVVTTASYEARALGVHSAMGLMKAASLAPDAILLPADFDEYRRYSRLFKTAVATVAPVIEDRGIDEIYIDLTDVPGAQHGGDDDPAAGVRAVAERIKQRVRSATGLSCSIGITPNKLLAKLCSDLDKPDGLTVVTETDIPSRIWPLPARRINGIGPKAAASLKALGIVTIGELAAADTIMLEERFGVNYGRWLHEAAQGHDERPVVTFREPKSLSRETTFERDLHPRRDRDALGAAFTRLCEQLAIDLQRKDYWARNIGVKLRYADFKTITRETTLQFYVQDAKSIRAQAARILKNETLDQRIRLLGVRAGSLCRSNALPVADGGVAEEPATEKQFDLAFPGTAAGTTDGSPTS